MIKKKLIEALTPKDTEELKPGLFIKSIPKNPDKIEYRQIHPIAWDGKFRLKNSLAMKRGDILRIIILLFVIWAYFNDTGGYRYYYETVNSDLDGFCRNVSLMHADATGTVDIPYLYPNLNNNLYGR